MLQDIRNRFNDNGIKRCLEPKDVLPTTAWKLDNSPGIYPEEIRISLKKVMMETTSFKQVCIESNDETIKIKDKVKDIISKRGKLHNPVTDTGGLVYGEVEEIGENYKNEAGIKLGDKIICNSSIASIPLFIDRISSINKTFSLLEVEGYAILFGGFPIVKFHEEDLVDLLMFAFNESGTPYAVSEYSKGKKDFLIVGDHLLSNLMFGYSIKKSLGEKAHIVCLLDKKS